MPAQHAGSEWLRSKRLCGANRRSRSRARRRGGTLVVVRLEQPDLREAAARTARDIARIRIFADVARDVIPIGAVAHAARLAEVVMAALGPALPTLHPAPLGRGTLRVRIPGFGVSVI